MISSAVKLVEPSGYFLPDFVVFPVTGLCGLHDSVFAEQGQSRKHVLRCARYGTFPAEFDAQ